MINLEFSFLFPEEFTCSIDWYSRYSCPYFVYSILFVAFPGFVPLVYLTLRLTYKTYFRSSASDSVEMHPMGLMSCLQSEPPPNPQPSTSTSVSVNVETEANKSSRKQSEVSNTSQIEKIKKPSRLRIHRLRSTSSSSTPSSFRTRHVLRNYSNSIVRSSSSSISTFTKSHVLTESRELPTVIICAWFFILSFVPKLLKNSCQACFLKTTLANNNIRHSFYLTFVDETVASVVIPLVLFVLHSKLRLSLTICLNFCLHLCGRPLGCSGRPSKRQMPSRHTSRASRRSKNTTVNSPSASTASATGCPMVKLCHSLASPSGNNSSYYNGNGEDVAVTEI